MDDVAAQTKLALRRLAKSVGIITTRWQGQRLAMAATAFEGLTLDPPAMLVCVARTASLAEPLTQGARFAINLLARDHVEISARCGAPWRGEERFGLGSWSDESEEVPLLRDAQASFVCVADMITDYGSHHIVVGKIERVVINGDVDPLVYVDGTYGRVLTAQPA